MIMLITHVSTLLADGMSNGSIFVSLHCWTNNVHQFDPSLRHALTKFDQNWSIGGGGGGEGVAAALFSSRCPKNFENEKVCSA